MDEFEKRQKLLQDFLLAEAGARTLQPAVSKRTLFGIKSTVEEKMDRFAHEIEDEYRRKQK